MKRNHCLEGDCFFRERREKGLNRRQNLAKGLCGKKFLERREGRSTLKTSPPLSRKDSQLKEIPVICNSET